MGRTRTRNLVIVHTPGHHGIQDWFAVAEKIKARSPDIRVRVVNNESRNRLARLWLRLRPSLVFSASPLQRFRPKHGKVYCGVGSRYLTKETEIRRMREAGLPVPETVKLTSGLRLEGFPWHPYVVVKPARGNQGKKVRLARTADLPRRYDELTDGGTIPMLVQPYIEHVDERGHPNDCRIITLFGRELVAMVSTWIEPLRPPEELAEDAEGVLASNAPSLRERSLSNDGDVLAPGRAVERVFPEIPVLGIDLVRETRTGRLYVMESNPSGRVWHFSSPRGLKNLSPEFRASMYAQFKALDRVADLLIEKTRAEAS